MNRQIVKGLLTLWQNSNKNSRYASMTHQFKQHKTFFYPDRKEEIERMKEQRKGELVPSENNGAYPKDYYYQLLGVTKNATVAQIKDAYHALAKRYHPDMNKYKSNIAKRFQDISNAYRVLVDEVKRQEYDRIENEKDNYQKPKQPSTQTPTQTPTQTAKPFIKLPTVCIQSNTKMTSKLLSVPPLEPRDVTPNLKDPGEFLKMNNVIPKLEITFLESVHGIKKIIDTQTLIKCPSCNGKSNQYASRTDSEPCRKCSAKGQISRKTATYTALVVCDQCNGKRYTNRNKCDLCDNRSFVYETYKVPVVIPVGITSGEEISVENPRDKQIVKYRVHVKENKYYTRIGNNIFSDKYITVSEAILGGTFKVRGIYGNIDLKVEPGTESHTQVRIVGKGVRNGSDYGDHIITIKIRIPQRLNMKQRQLILSLAKSEDPIFETYT